MKRLVLVVFILTALSLGACNTFAPQPATPTPQPPTIVVIPTLAPSLTSVPQAVPTTAPTEENDADRWSTFTNSDFGFSFEYPSDWFGPDEYISEQMLRLEVGSDNVYPYGTDPTQRVYAQKDSYYVLIQYSKNNQNSMWKETYDSLVNLGNDESIGTARSLSIKVRDLEHGRFKGVEYISTLPETAQTEAVYMRNVILFDDQNNVITIMGQPNNVEVGENWREAYQRIDELNMETFDHIVESIQAE